MRNRKLRELGTYSKSIASDLKEAVTGDNPRIDLRTLAEKIRKNVKARIPAEIGEFRRLIQTRTRSFRRRLVARPTKKKTTIAP